MSTGLDCIFVERNPNEWYLLLEEEYGFKLDPEYDKYGPFYTFSEAYEFLGNFANPGGYSIRNHPDSTDMSWDEDDEWL